MIRPPHLFFAAALLVAAGGERVRAAVSSETVTSLTLSAAAGLESSLGRDALNGVHISFFDPAVRQVKYAVLTNGSPVWSVSAIDSSSDFHSTSTALAVDSLNRPHIVYYNETDDQFLWTYLSGGAWQTPSVIDTDASTAPFVSLALDANNRPRVLYNVTSALEVRFASYDGTSWTNETVINSTMVAPGDLALDSSGRAHVVLNATASSVDYLVYISEIGDFFAAVLGDGTAPGNVSVALDSSDIPHISAYEESAGNLWYFTGASSALSITTVAATGDVGRNSSIALNAQGKPVIAAFQSGAGLGLYSFSTVWSSTTLDASVTAGEGNSLSLNGLGSAFVSYHNASPAGLAFASTAERNLSLSGTVRDSVGAGLPDVTVSLSGLVPAAGAVTAAPGTFSFGGLWEGSYALTPFRDGYGFIPGRRTLLGLTTSQVSQDFLGGPLSLSLLDNLFNPDLGQAVQVTYSVLSGKTALHVYDLRGVRVKTLVDRREDIGTYTVSWDGRDGAGEVVASGVYLIRLESEGLKKTLKAAVVR
jgi:hypothetical protein